MDLELLAPQDSLSFPSGFRWGASTSAHQIEGGNTNNDWWRLEHSGTPAITEVSGDACDSYHRWPEDLDLVASIGLNTYRFSLEWSRIEPARGEFSRAALDHYRRVIDGCRDRGLSVALTLHHFTLPGWLADSGSWLAPDSVELFERYCETVLPLCGDGVDSVCTINEPNIVAAQSDMGQARPAVGLPAPHQGVADALLEAHDRVRHMIRANADVAVGWSVANQAVAADEGCELQAEAYRYDREDQFLELARDDDYIGVQAYTRTLVGPHGAYDGASDAPRTLTNWEYYPDALADAVRHAWSFTEHTPILVTENGIATDDDTRRIAYTQGALAGLHGCITDGVDVRGYLHWSLFDNFEWFLGYRPTFGLVAVDRSTFVRTPKPSAYWLGSIARANALPGLPRT